MPIDVSHRGDITVLSPGQRLTRDRDAPDLRATVGQLLSEGQRKLVIDLSNVTGIDATGIGVLVRALSETTRHGGRAVFVEAERVREVLGKTRLDSVFQFYKETEDAVASFREG